MKNITVKEQPVSFALIEGQVIVTSAGSLAADNRAIKKLEAAIAKAIKATGLDAEPKVNLRRLVFSGRDRIVVNVSGPRKRPRKA